MNIKEIIDHITLVTTIQGLIFGLILFFSIKKNHSNIYFGLFLLMFTGTSIQWYFNSILPKFILTPITFSYLVIPIFFLYTQSILGKIKLKTFIHIVPGIIEFVINCYFACNPSFAETIYSKDAGLATILFLILLPPIYNVLYCLLIINSIRKNKAFITNFYTQTETKRINWIVITSIILIIDFITELLSSLGMLISSLDLILYLYEAISTCFIVYWSSIYGLNQKNLIPVGETATEENKTNNTTINQLETTKLETPNPKSIITETTGSKINLGAKDLNQEPDKLSVEINKTDYDKIVTFFCDTKIYCNKEISLFMLADLVQMRYKDVSKLINYYSGKNFNQFVNYYRIEEAKKLLEDTQKNHLNLNGIADEVGFSSRSTFFLVFKQQEGITPNEFKKASVNQMDNL
jgi:AraC-like DNA-binding protein